MIKKHYTAPAADCTEMLSEALLCVSDIVGSIMEGFGYEDKTDFFGN